MAEGSRRNIQAVYFTKEFIIKLLNFIFNSEKERVYEKEAKEKQKIHQRKQSIFNLDCWNCNYCVYISPRYNQQARVST